MHVGFQDLVEGKKYQETRAFHGKQMVETCKNHGFPLDCPWNPVQCCMVYQGFPTLKATFQEQAADLFQAQSPAIDPSLRWENQWRFEAIVAMGEISVFFSLEPCVINKKMPYKPI